MLRVEASNLKTTGDPPRPRRLLPRPPAVPDFSQTPARDLLLPPPDDTSASERWLLRLELGDEDIAKLYSQGMARGAVVWRKGMVEWRPLLITPELTRLLRRTRTTLTSLPDGLAERPVGPTTVAPTALDVVAPNAAAVAKPRRAAEFVAVALAAFVLAWIARGSLRQDSPSTPAADSREAPAPVAATCEPAAPTTARLFPNAPPVASDTGSTITGSTIPTIAVTDLPLVGSAMTSATRHSESRRAPSRAAATGQPSRSELRAALSRVAQAARGCGERGGAPVRLTMSFSGSGVARSIQVSGRELPAPTRSCILAAASRARVPAFSGDPVTVAKTL